MLAKIPPIPDPTTSISIATLNTYAGLEEEARSLATRGLPKADQTMPCKPEGKIIELIEARFAARNDARDKLARQIEDQLAHLPNPQNDRNLHHMDAQVTDELMKVFHTRLPVIPDTVAAERTSQAELNAFRDRHRLGERQAVYPLSRIHHFAMVILVMLLEATGNMFLLVDAVTTGLLGALVTAIMIAATNIALAVFIGLVPLRYLNIRHAED